MTWKLKPRVPITAIIASSTVNARPTAHQASVVITTATAPIETTTEAAKRGNSGSGLMAASVRVADERAMSRTAAHRRLIDRAQGAGQMLHLLRHDYNTAGNQHADRYVRESRSPRG
jgi:hypothetical protein